jgi:4-hydroxyphenylacetate 3-monooxygenase
MIRTGQQYRDSIRDGRQVWINGERVKDVTAHPMFRPLVDVRALHSPGSGRPSQ